MWAPGETDGPKKFGSGACLLRASGEIDERRFFCLENENRGWYTQEISPSGW
jgi:hypothetical protein